MILIEEKINGSIPSVAKAIAERNEDWIRNLARTLLMCVRLSRTTRLRRSIGSSIWFRKSPTRPSASTALTLPSVWRL